MNVAKQTVPDIAWDDLVSELPWIDACEVARIFAAACFQCQIPRYFSSHASIEEDSTIVVSQGCLHPLPARLALEGAYHLLTLCSAAKGAAPALTRETLDGFATMMTGINTWQPCYRLQALLNAAGPRKIPAYPILHSPNSALIGEGARAYRHYGSAAQATSLTSKLIAGNKHTCSKFVASLGYPVAENFVEREWPALVRTAERLGYPVVVKPVAGGGGFGVTVGVSSRNALRRAMDLAQQHGANGNYLVEKFIAGDSYRFSVFDGKLVRASQLVPPVVTGDGTSSIEQLVQQDNSRRSPSELAEGVVFPLKIDAAMQEVLMSQDLTQRSVPAAGQRVLLRRTSNLHAGGRLLDVTDLLHPDLRNMAETIARCLGTDAAGVDFITTDITKSWTDIPCAVIEINVGPGIGSVIAQRVIRNRFADGSDARIPSVMMVNGSEAMVRDLSARLASKGLGVGWSTGSATEFRGERRFVEGKPLASRIHALLMEPACEAIVFSIGKDDLIANGMPMQSIVLAIATADAMLSPEVASFVKRHSAHFATLADSETPADLVETFISEARAD